MITPKPHLSWTQLDTIERSVDLYRRIYIDGERRFVNKGMALGKEIASAIESGQTTGDLINDLLIAKLPKFEVVEMECRAVIQVSGVEIPLLSYIDTARRDLTAFKEYKTGVTPWSQDKVNKFGQITFYCVVAQAITGKIPQDIELIWAPTTVTWGGKVELTGEIKQFTTHRTTADILKMKVRMKQAWNQIGALTEEIL